MGAASIFSVWVAPSRQEGSLFIQQFNVTPFGAVVPCDRKDDVGTRCEPHGRGNLCMRPPDATIRL